jgi:hypothetical protein
VSIGVIGLGEVAQIIHLPILESLRDRFRIAAICDVSPTLVDAMGERYRVPPDARYADYRDLVTREDVDAVFALTGRPLGSHRTAASYGFLGMGKSAMDTANARATNKNWSYGIGSMVPLGASLDLFAEWRWRMSKFVLPTARPRPTRSKEARFGLSFHLARRD